MILLLDGNWRRVSTGRAGGHKRNNKCNRGVQRGQGMRRTFSWRGAWLWPGAPRQAAWQLAFSLSSRDSVSKTLQKAIAQMR